MNTFTRTNPQGIDFSQHLEIAFYDGEFYPIVSHLGNTVLLDFGLLTHRGRTYRVQDTVELSKVTIFAQPNPLPVGDPEFVTAVMELGKR